MPIDAQQLAELIDRHAGALRLWIRSRCASAEDVVQEAFCRLAQQEPVPDKPAAWLYRVCRNLGDKERRTADRRRRREGEWVLSKEGATTSADPLELEETMAAVERLDNDLREVLVARLWGQLTFEEIASLCGISTATAFRRYEAALKTLMETLEPKCEEPL